MIWASISGGRLIGVQISFIQICVDGRIFPHIDCELLFEKVNLRKRSRFEQDDVLFGGILNVRFN